MKSDWIKRDQTKMEERSSDRVGSYIGNCRGLLHFEHVSSEQQSYVGRLKILRTVLTIKAD
jgi:hypothetical protein